jgi:hypothetical protein
MSDLHKLLVTWCKPSDTNFGIHLPIVGDTAQRLHKIYSGAVDHRGTELLQCSQGLHEMALGLAQVAANYSNTDVQVATNFENGKHMDERIAETLPPSHDFVVRPHR